MKNLIIYPSAIVLIFSAFSLSLVETTLDSQTTQKVESDCCCQYETYEYLKDGTKKFSGYCYSWTTPERCAKNFASANGKAVSKPKEECKCVVPR
jgi:hypothetical protein